jgi:transposase
MPGYDSRRRRWRHLDTCQLRTVLEADVPRGTCPTHGIHQIGVPWAEDRSRFTALFERMAIAWLLEAGQTAVARRMGLTWDEVHGIMVRAVERGLARQKPEVVSHMGVDETSFQKRHEYVTVVCDIRKPRVLHVGDGRSKEALDAFYGTLTPEQMAGIEAVAMDMSESYIRSTQEHVPDAAEKIVFDKFHIVGHVSDAVDKVRRQEHRTLLREGDERLKGTKYLWLFNPWNLTEEEEEQFEALRHDNLKTGRAWALKETILRIWDKATPEKAKRFFAKWYGWAMRSRLEPMKKVARMLKSHLENVVTYIKHRITSAVAEGLNAKIQWIKFMARGFRNRKNFRIAILFHCGGLDLYPHETQ